MPNVTPGVRSLRQHELAPKETVSLVERSKRFLSSRTACSTRGKVADTCASARGSHE